MAGMFATPWGGYMPEDAGISPESSFMTIPKRELPAGAVGGLEEGLPAPELEAKVEAKPKKKLPPSYTRDQLALLSAMVSGPRERMRAPGSGSMGGGMHPQVKMGQLETPGVALRPSLGAILYRGK